MQRVCCSVPCSARMACAAGHAVHARLNIRTPLQRYHHFAIDPCCTAPRQRICCEVCIISSVALCANLCITVCTLPEACVIRTGLRMQRFCKGVVPGMPAWQYLLRVATATITRHLHQATVAGGRHWQCEQCTAMPKPAKAFCSTRFDGLCRA